MSFIRSISRISLLSIFVASLASSPSISWAEEDNLAGKNPDRAKAYVSPSPYIVKLDQILLGAGGVRGFLENTRAQNEYYSLWLQYVNHDQSRFPRAGFEKIIEQMKAHIDLIPSLEARLMEEETSAPDLSFDVRGLKGKVIDQEAYREFLMSWMGTLFNQSLELGEKTFLDSKLMAKTISKLLAKWKKQDADFEKTLKELTRKKRDDAYRIYVEKIREDGERQSVVATLLGSLLWNGLLKTVQWGDGADSNLSPYLILTTLMSLRQDPQRVFEPFKDLAELQSQGAPLGLKQMIRDSLPTLESLEEWKNSRGQNLLVAASDAGPQKTNASRIQLVSMRRNFHRSFKGLPLKECIGGLPDSGHLQNCTIERWGTGLLSGSWFHAVEIGNHFGGYVHHIPVEIDGAKFVSVDLMSSHLIQRLSHYEEKKKTFYSEPLIVTMLRKFKEKFPPEWKGVALSDSSYNDHARVFGQIKGMSIYDQAQKLGLLGTPEVKVADSALEAEIAAHWTGPNVSQTYTRGQRFIFNGTNKDAANFRILTIPEQDVIVSNTGNNLELSPSLEGNNLPFVENFLSFLEKSNDFLNSKIRNVLGTFTEATRQARQELIEHRREVHRNPNEEKGPGRYLFQHMVGVTIGMVLGRAVGLVPVEVDFGQYMFMGGITTFIARVMATSFATIFTLGFQERNGREPMMRKFFRLEQTKPLKYVIAPAIPLSIIGYHCMNALMHAGPALRQLGQ